MDYNITMEMDEELFEEDEIVVNNKEISAPLAACSDSTIYKMSMSPADIGRALAEMRGDVRPRKLIELGELMRLYPYTINTIFRYKPSNLQHYKGRCAMIALRTPYEYLYLQVTTVKLENDSQEQEPEPGCSSWSQSDVGQQKTGSGFCQIFIKEEVQDLSETGECLEDQELTSVESGVAPISSEDADGSEVGELHREKGNLSYFAKCANVSIVENDLRTHQDSQLFSCAYCNYKKYAKLSGLEQHINKNHPGEKPYACNICDYECSHHIRLELHLRSHTVEKSHPGEKTFSCGFCNYKCFSSSSLKSHLRTHKGKKPFSCEFCDYKCSLSSVLKKHLTTHTGEKPLSCEFCDYKCSYLSLLKKHLTTHTGEKPFSCEFCDYKCSQSSHLNSHLRTHTGEKPFSCEFCDYKCSLSYVLKKHLRTHTGEKPFSCEFCDYKCSETSSLKTHLRTHTGEKPFCCHFCDFKCSHSSCLKTHLRRHTGEKPFSCDFCDYKSSQSSHLKTHLKKHR